MSRGSRIASLGSSVVRLSLAAIACVMLVASSADAQAYHFAFGITAANGPSWGTGPHSSTVTVTNDGSSTIPAGVVISLENRMGTGLNNLTFQTGSGTFIGNKVTQNGPCTPFAMSPYIGSTGHYASLNCKGTLNSAFAPGQTITATYTFTITTPTPQMLFTSNNLLDCGTGWIVTPGWTFSGAVYCGAPATATTGTLAVRKVVVNNTGSPAPIPPTFATTTHCSQNAATLPVHTPVAVPGNATVTQPGQVNAGLNCSVTETLPPPIPNLEACKGRGATWTASYSPPVTIVAGQTALLTVTNTLTCNPPTGGSLQIHKSVVNTLNVPTPPSFNMVASCSGMNPVPVTVAVNGTVTVPPAGQIAGGTVCTITETLPPPVLNVKACQGGTASWVASNPGPLTVHIAQTTGTIITNTLTCDKPPAGGRLTVYKSVVNATGGPAPIPATFAMTVTCTTGQNPAIAVAPGATGTTVNGIAAPNQCAVAEQRLPQIADAKGCHGGTASWTTAYSPAQPVAITAGGTTTVTVRNTLTCDKPTNIGSLKVVKSVSNSTGGPVLMPATFAMTVNCTPSGPSNQAISVAPGATGTTINGIAAPSQCVVSEAPLAQIAHAEGCQGGSASWSTAYSPAQPVAITANGTTTVTVRNTLTCDKPANTDCPNPGMTTIGCRVTVTVKRSKGPNIYSVLVSPPATSPTPTPNVAPSTSASCVIAGMAMINQTTCWFNYSTNPTSVTLTATSSAGALPAGFSWSGACSGSSPTCVVSAKLILPPSVMANFP